jgi:transcription antitermination protein NusB
VSEQTAKTKTSVRSPRHRARELVMQGIYQWRLSGADAAQIEQRMHDEKNLGRYDTELCAGLLRGVLARHADLEAALAPHLDRASNELSPVEFSILLLGAYEMLLQPATPYRVIINEAVELAKTYGGTDGHKFVNGVLDKLAAQVRTAEVAAK